MSRKKDQETGFSLLIATVKHVWVDLKMKLIIPLTFYSGLEQAFIFADFTAVSYYLVVSQARRQAGREAGRQASKQADVLSCPSN